MGVLMLVPAAAAFAAGTVTVEVEGTGSGEVSSVGEEFEGSPPIECAYDGETEEASGQCGPSEMTVGSPAEGIILNALPAPGSELILWIVEGEPFLESGCSDPSKLKCNPADFAGTNGEYTVTAIFEPCSEESEAESCEEAPAEQPLTFNINEGEGTVVSNPAGLECTGSEGESCEASFEEGAEVTLTASPAAGYRFYTWQNCPPEGYEGRTCTVEMNEATEVGVKFKKTSALTVSKAEGSEPGIIKSDPGGAICFFPCDTATIAFDEGKEVTVFTKAPNHRHFVEFTGGTGQTEACNGETSCAFTANGTDSSIEALFAEDEQATLSVNKAGGGQAKITIQPANVVCVNTCSATTAEFYAEPEAEEATVEWDLAKGTSSIEWTTGAGTCTGSSEADKGECTVTMDEAHELVAALE